MEETKYSDSEHQGEDNKPYNFISASTRAKVKTKKQGKEGNIILELAQEKNFDINSRDACAL